MKLKTVMTLPCVKPNFQPLAAGMQPNRLFGYKRFKVSKNAIPWLTIALGEQVSMQWVSKLVKRNTEVIILQSKQLKRLASDSER